jgi:hypothetical protein
VLRQRADPEADRAHALERIGEISADNRDKAGRETALRRHDALGALRERADVTGGRHVFGEVEIVGDERVGRRCDGLVENVAQAGQHRLLALQRREKRRGVGEIGLTNGEGRVGNRARVEPRHLESGLGQKLCGEMTDVAEPQDRDCRERHRPPRPLAMKGCDSPFGESVGDGTFSIAWAPFTTTIASS